MNSIESASSRKMINDESSQYRQSLRAILIDYAFYRWLLAFMTCGIIVLYDYLMYRNTKIKMEGRFISYETGALIINSKDIPYEDIKNIRIRQSIIGQWFNYGDVIISMRELRDTIVMKRLDNPELLRGRVQSVYVKAEKLKLS